LRDYYAAALAIAGAVLVVVVVVVVVAEHNKQPRLGQPHCRPLRRMNSSRAVDTGKDLVFRIYQNARFVLGYMPYWLVGGACGGDE
jgi:hypothetical protein